MRFPRTPSGSRSTVLDRLDAMRSARAASEDETEFLEQLIFTGRPLPVAESGEKEQAPQKVKAKPAKPAKNSGGAAPPNPPARQAQGEALDKSKLSPFETELLTAWSED